MPRVSFAKIRKRDRGELEKYRKGRGNGKWKVEGEKKRRDLIGRKAQGKSAKSAICEGQEERKKRIREEVQRRKRKWQVESGRRQRTKEFYKKANKGKECQECHLQRPR